MTEPGRRLSIQEMYGDQGMPDDAIRARLDRSLDPRGPGVLHDKLMALGLTRGHVVLDIGSRDARHACDLAQRSGCRVLAVDPVGHHFDLARRLVSDRGLADVVHVVGGRIESIPCADRSVDFIWCRDMLNHVPALAAALGECARVLRPDGRMLVFQTFATDLLEPREAARLYAAVATTAESMSVEHFERSVRDAGLELSDRDILASEWREYGEERGGGQTSKQLLYIARLIRARERLLEELGPVAFEAELGDCHWGVYQMLGKLCPRIYVLAKPA